MNLKYFRTGLAVILFSAYLSGLGDFHFHLHHCLMTGNIELLNENQPVNCTCCHIHDHFQCNAVKNHLPAYSIKCCSVSVIDLVFQPVIKIQPFIILPLTFFNSGGWINHNRFCKFYQTVPYVFHENEKPFFNELVISICSLLI